MTESREQVESEKLLSLPRLAGPRNRLGSCWASSVSPAPIRPALAVPSMLCRSAGGRWI